VNLFLFGFAVGQLVYAPFSNRFNRKTTLFAGLILASFGALICSLSYFLQAFSILLCGLLAMSLGASVGLSLTFTIINDSYDTEKARKVIPLVTLSFSVMPGLAVLVGGVIVSHFEWPGCFHFLLGYFLFAIYLVYLLPETSKILDPDALRWKNIFSRYKTVFLNKTIWLFSLKWGLCTAIVYIYAAEAPLIVIEKMKVSPERYGTLNLVTSAGFITGTLLTRLLVSKISPLPMMLAGLMAALFGSVLLIVFSNEDTMNPWSVFLPMFFVFFGLPAVFSTASSLALRELLDKATASSFMTFINMSAAVVSLMLIVMVPGDPERVMEEFIVGILLIIAALIAYSSRAKLFK
jgi:MFS family permease